MPMLVVVLVDEISAADLRVDLGNELQRVHRGSLMKNDMKPSLMPYFSEKTSVVPLAQRHDARHVDPR